MSEQHTFQAEIKQLLDILVHSLYTDREIFLRELVSNASDALSKIQFEILTNKDVLDADAPLKIEIYANPDNRTIRIVDTGIGMTHDEMISNLGVIAQSGAKSFMERIKDSDSGAKADLIGQFGVGFYSVFMVADKVEVTSRSYLTDESAYTWISSGEDTYEIIPAEKDNRGTEILIHLREDAADFANDYRLRQTVKQHSDYVAFPIYVMTEATKQDEESEDEEKETETEKESPKPVNQQQAIWRRSSTEIEDSEYNDFYRMLTLDFEEPALRIHTHGDAPIQYYALLYIPRKSERNILSLRKEPGLKLYTRKILIQEYTTDLLPEYLYFVQGVVDSEDIPLNVSRESVQANPLIAKLKQVITRRILSELKTLSENDAEAYAKIWNEYSAYLKHGVISDYSDRERLLPLLRFHTSNSGDDLISLDEYVEHMESVEGQEEIYYITADSIAAAKRSPHLDPFRARGIDVLYLTESVDGFLVNALGDYKGHKLISADAANLDLDDVGELSEEESAAEAIEGAALDKLLVRMRNVLGDSVESVRVSKVMSGASPVRLVAPEGAIDRHTQRVYQMLERDFEVPARILEINPRNTIIANLAARLERGIQDDELVDGGITLLYQNALLADGIHPNPPEITTYIQAMMEFATRLTE
ncbi:MAG TPA: molecular chaperone HtpG [Aggregatilineales bacterium]|nr:molecular chaperone HtpG [Aggregatilineales bacterium]